MILAGSTVRTENVELLATMLEGELAAKLSRAVENDNSIVALSIAEREQIVTALAERQPQFVELRAVLVAQLARLKKQEAREAQSQGMRRARLAHDRDRRLRER